jgi:hypothetical protein
MENKKIIKKFIKKIINELDMSTYKDIKLSTDDYPSKTFIDKSKDKYENPNSIGNKNKRVNSLAKEMIFKTFYNEFPPYTEKTNINTKFGIYELDSLKIKYNSYNLIFNKQKPFSNDQGTIYNTLLVQFIGGKIRFNFPFDEIDPKGLKSSDFKDESLEKINNMFSKFYI